MSGAAVPLPAEGGFRATRLAALFGALTALGGFTLDSNTAAFPAMRAALSASTAATQATLTAVLIGLTIGQLLLGPVSDRYGRRGPLLVSLVAYVVLSVACAAAGNVVLLIGLRFLQGVFAACGMVIARAIARDLFSGRQLTRFYAQMVSITMLVPIVAPVVGSQLLGLVGWRGLFLVMGGIGIVLLALVAVSVRETLRVEERLERLSVFGGFGRLARTPSFLAVGAVLGLSFAAVMVYTAGSSFLLQDHYGLSPRGFGVLTAVTGLGIVAAGQLNVRLPDRWAATSRAGVALAASTVAALYLVVTVVLGGPLAAVIPGVIVMMICHGICWPNVMSTGMGLSDRDAGAASALLGAMQFGVGGLLSPVSALFGDNQAVGTVASMLVLIAGAAAVFATGVVRRRAPR